MEGSNFYTYWRCPSNFTSPCYARRRGSKFFDSPGNPSSSGVCLSRNVSPWPPVYPSSILSTLHTHTVHLPADQGLKMQVLFLVLWFGLTMPFTFRKPKEDTSNAVWGAALGEVIRPNHAVRSKKPWQSNKGSISQVVHCCPPKTAPLAQGLAGFVWSIREVILSFFFSTRSPAAPLAPTTLMRLDRPCFLNDWTQTKNAPRQATRLFGRDLLNAFYLLERKCSGRRPVVAA